MEQLKQLNVVVSLGVDEAAEWCNSFVSVLKPNWKVSQYLDAARLYQALIRPVNRDPAVNEISPKLMHAKYLTLYMQLQATTN